MRKTSRNPKLVGNRRRRTSRNIGARGTYPAPLTKRFYAEKARQELLYRTQDTLRRATLKARVAKLSPSDEKTRLLWLLEDARDLQSPLGLLSLREIERSLNKLKPNRRRASRRTSRNGDLAALKARVAGLPRGGEKSRLQWLLDESRGNPSYLREIEYSLGKMGA